MPLPCTSGYKTRPPEDAAHSVQLVGADHLPHNFRWIDAWHLFNGSHRHQANTALSVYVNLWIDQFGCCALDGLLLQCCETKR